MKSSMHRCLLPVLLLAILLGTVDFATSGELGGFTVVLLPDTQFYAESFPDTYLAQTRWIASRSGPENIKFVIHLGDIVQNPEVEKEWQNADRAHRVLDGVVPYSVLPGNHDMVERDTALFNKYFPPKRFKKHSWYGGNEDGTNDNNYCFFEASGMKFMVLSLECEPSDRTLDWAGNVVRSHKDRRVIVATHYYSGPEGRRPIGEKIWNRLVRKHKNIFMVHCGHIIGIGLETGKNDAGGTVYEILTDYQGLPNGGNGWLRFLRFVPSENKIYIRAYSPLLDKYNNDPKHTYSLDYKMGGAGLKKAALGPAQK